MLENLPDAVGHFLRDQRAGLDKTAFHAVDLRGGMASIAVTSLAFADHMPIPERYTADGEGVSPPLAWSGVPAAAASVAVIVEDADAPTPSPLVHAIVVDLPRDDREGDGAGAGALAEAALPSDGHDGSGLSVGRNSYLQTSWLPPDPPPGHGVHRYVFQVFALESGAGLGESPGREALLEAIRDHGLASGCLIGTYERPDTSIGISSAEEGAPVATPPLAI